MGKPSALRLRVLMPDDKALPMKITRVTSHVLQYDLPEELGYSQQFYATRTCHLVEVETDEGITGWGECFGPGTIALANKGIVEKVIQPMVLGMDPMDRDVIWHKVYNLMRDHGQKGMPLQTDPTVIYGVTGGKGPLGRGLRKSELRKDTPWNTYVNRGLPPTPIANPGLASLQAALKPAATDFIFFVADGTGGHAFAVTLKDHNRNVAAWRKIEATRQP